MEPKESINMSRRLEKEKGEPNCGEEEKKKGGEGRVLEERKERAKNLREKF